MTKQSNWKCWGDSSSCSYEIPWDKLESSQKKKKSPHAPASPWSGVEGRLGTAFPPSWTVELFKLICGPQRLGAILQCREWPQGKPCLKLGSSGLSQAHSKAAGVVKVSGGFLKSTVLFLRKLGDPGRAGSESEISSYILLEFCTWKLEILEDN